LRCFVVGQQAHSHIVSEQPVIQTSGFVLLFLQVCPTRYEWVEPLLPKLQDVDVQRLSGGKLKAQEAAAATAAADVAAAAAGAGQASDGEAGGQKLARRNHNEAVNAARQRYLQRKQAAAAAGKKK
jgi:ATP-dependent RNA helicase DHX8/PRP22